MKLKKIVILFVILSIINLFFNINNVNAVNNAENTQTEDIIVEIADKEELSNTVKNLILTINSEGLNKTLLSYAINLYVEASEVYSNNEIAELIEENKEELVQNGVSEQDVNSITTVLKNVDTVQLRKVLNQINIDEIALKIEDGESLQEIFQETMDNMSTTEKVSLIANMLLSAYVIKKVLWVLLIIFIYRTLLRCVIYRKAGKRAWAPFIPIYRNVVMLKICKMSPWWLLLLLVPVVGWIILWIVCVASKFMLAESFGKGTVFAFGLWLLPPIFETILVFSRKTKYIGFEEN